MRSGLRAVELTKHLKDRGQQLLLDSYPCVCHLKLSGLCSRGIPGRYGDMTLVRKFEGVVNEILENMFELVAVDRNGAKVRRIVLVEA